MNHLGTKKLQSERLILRRFKESDAEEIYEGYVNQEGFLYYAHKEKWQVHMEEIFNRRNRRTVSA